MSGKSKQKKIAAINDLSGYGRCALTVSLPVISHMRIQCCPVPTSILSNHTGYDEYFFDDYSDKLPQYFEMWEKLELTFDGIMSGFLGSKEQIDMVVKFIHEFSEKDTKIIIGDHGKIAGTYTEEMCIEMRKLVSYADIVTPNLTEACKLVDMPYKETGWKKKELQLMAEKVSQMGPDKVVITGIPQGEFIANYVYEKGEESHFIKTHKVGEERCGTGDLFASIIAADAVNGVDFQKSVRKASAFVKKSMLKSIEMNIPKKNGVCFEEILHKLKVD